MVVRTHSAKRALKRAQERAAARKRLKVKTPSAAQEKPATAEETGISIPVVGVVEIPPENCFTLPGALSEVIELNERVGGAECATFREPEKGITVMESPAATMQRLGPRAAEFAAGSRSKSTQREYKRQWRDWSAWCAARGVEPLPGASEALALYITELAAAPRSVSTINQALSAIRFFHRKANAVQPAEDARVQEIWEGIRRAKANEPKKKARPVGPDQLRAMLEGVSVRDRAIILVGFAGGFRRKELAELDVDDVTAEEKGFVVRVRKGKTDQEGHGLDKVIDYGEHEATCPARALNAWLLTLVSTGNQIGQTIGPLFRSRTGRRLNGKEINRILKRAAGRAGMSLDRLSSHSLRAGFVTTSARAGVSLLEIVEQTGQTVATAQGYVRGLQLMNKGVAKKIGL